MENESFFKQYFENNNFGFPFDIGKEIRIKFLKFLLITLKMIIMKVQNIN